VAALYAELDERAEQLRQASELKTRFLSHMSHEFRTPLNSSLALSRLPDRIDALKFTERGEVRVTARLPAGTRVISKNTISRENVSLFLRDATAGAP
jgi:GAF domain-containing protein